MKKLLSIILVLVMIMAMVPAAALQSDFQIEGSENPESEAVFDDGKEEIGANDIVTFMVKLKDKPVAAVVRNINSAAAKKKTAELSVKQNDIENRIKALCDDGDKVEVTRRYSALFNGIAVKAPFYMKERMESIPGVTKVFVEPAYEMPPIVKAEDEKLNTSVDLIHAHDAWDAGYTGKGTVIAIVDSGCVVDHKAFSTAPASPKLNRNSIANVLRNYNMQAETISNGQITAGDLYYSAKIPFRFNYVTGDNDVSHRLNKLDHGTHVAGIAAGYSPDSTYNGVAKDAQLVIMNVFEGSTVWFSTLLTALEDCLYLGVDAINMSLGRACGFSHDSFDSQEVFDLLDSHGCNVICASGNDGSYDGTQFYGSKNRYSLTMNPDNGVIAFPASVSSNVGVACCTKTGNSITTFTSRGTTSDLKLKPEIAAPGSEIIAPVDTSATGNTTSYGSKSGTSMSSPHVVGAMSIVAQYVNQKWPNLTGKEKYDLVQSLVMCTADTIDNTSPLAQGSGIVDVIKAVSTGAYIKVDGCPKPKLELGDDPNRTGIFELNFNVVNFSNKPLTYQVDTSVFTEGHSNVKVNNQQTYRMNGTVEDIKSDCIISGDETITVPAGSTKSVSITIQLRANARSLFDTYYEKGGYVEGFVKLIGETDLVVPYLGFYGNWNEPSVFDRYTFIDEIRGVNKFNVHTRQLTVGAVRENGECLPFGKNPYMDSTDWFADRCALSPNNDGFYDKIDKLQFSIIRNCKEVGIEIYDEETPSIKYFDEKSEYVSRCWDESFYDTDVLEFTEWTPDGLKEGDRVVFRLYAELDNPGFTHDQNECSEIVLPMVIDTKAPRVTYWKLEDGILRIGVKDENYVAWLGVYSDPECTELIKQRAITEKTRGVQTIFNLILDGYSTVYVKLGDYAHNTSEVYTITGEGGSFELGGISLAPNNIELDINEKKTITLTATPAEANNFDVVWSSSNDEVASVTGSQYTAEVCGGKVGTAVINAVATDLNSGRSFTCSVDVKVIDSSNYGYLPVNQIELGETYLIGYKDNNAVYLIMNYNPNPVGIESTPNNYRVYYQNDYYSYGIRALTDSRGDVLAVDNSVYPDAKLKDAEWHFVSNGGYYKIQSANNQNYYLRVSTSSARLHLFNTSGTSYATKWKWDSTNNCLYYYASSSLSKNVKFVPNIANNSNFFCAAADSYSAIQLYKRVDAASLPVQQTTFTVVFKDWDGTVLKTEQVAEGGAATAPNNPTREGYTFTGWDKTFNNITADTVVTAQYTQNAVVNYYTVTFKDWDGTVLSTQTVSYGGSATAPANPTRKGYTFTGWDKAFNNITADTVVTAQYTINTYTVTFKDWDGTTLKTQTVNYGGAATAPANPTREGYTFTGWDRAFNNITANTVVTAQYTQNPVVNYYTVTFKDWDGTVLKTEQVAEGESATAPNNPTRTGYTFTGWDKAFTNITADTVITAQYTQNAAADKYMPAVSIVEGKDYVLGYSDGKNVYLIMNYNADPLTSAYETNNYRYIYSNNYYAYGVKAVLDESGNVVDVDRSIYPNACVENMEWNFIKTSKGYKIRSAKDATMYLRAHANAKYTHLFISSGYYNATDWNWNYSQRLMSYKLSGGVTKYISYVPTVNGYRNFFMAGTSIGTIVLYRRVEQINSMAVMDETNTIRFYTNAQ
ncbi:MAG: S8 family serine peptidase [Clostridia bacterium]|nr:S8 family serine peptidase [Clostridia bacterium]